ncbi:T-complex protein 11-like protein 1 isoform X4 [Phyllostomus hastatus]|uniref:T-complex protein 11-like protein 1 isoform X4 n=1 Tax=Phyllostomus hastatus TaxID=9423 RepID=UPI001E684185|nr:T-complex protein 11-like protein 1 isoform X4 [Phyllostomus hastatus]
MSENLNKSSINEAGKSKSNDSEQGLEDAAEGSDEASREKIKSGSPSAQRVQRPHSSPPRFVTVEELLETAKGVTNMVLAHEIVVNGDFRIKPVELPEDSLEKRVKEIVHKAFWDCLSVQLSEDPPTYDHAIKLVGEIKETLLSFLLPGHSRLRNQITEVLDLELIKQEAENGALDISKLAEFVIDSLDFVTQWLEEAAEDLMNQRYKNALPAEGGAAGSGDSLLPNPAAVQNYAYLRLLRWDHLRRPFPETVLMDQSRFQELQLQLEQVAILGAVLLVTFSMAASGISSQASFAEKLKMIVKILLTDLHLPSFHLRDALTTIGEKVCQEVSSRLSLCGFAPFTTDKETVLKGQIQAVANPDDPIRRIMDSRILAFLESCLASGHQKPLPTVPGGLGPVQKELEEVAIKFVRLVNYNKMVFSPYYDAVLTLLLPPKTKCPVACKVSFRI